MDGFTAIVLILNTFISLFSAVDILYKKRKCTKKYKNISEEFVRELEILEDKINSPKFDVVLKNSSYDIKTKMYSDKIFRKNKNRFMIYIIMNESCKFFSDIYNDKDLYCNIRVNKHNNFYTIAHFRCQDTLSINDRLYYTNKNTDLINITNKKINRFIISNVDDYIDSNIFVLQNEQLKSRSKAIISIPIMDSKDLIGTFTIYFSKPLNDKIKLFDLELAITTLKNRIVLLLKEYIVLNENEFESEKNILIENKISN